ncbi:TonB-dependent receptor [Flavobacterium sp. LS1R10]|uniref:TonB-dependent receptor n=1 Tax=Flavobacterium sp. LS1R10 TaxID=2497482 RepID=UPI000F835709|nr:TonB-dependent receptor [Flavobacterium sp. LS1R10]RTY74320.1 hypothetical protein EKL96_09690 [Flavobacterium sp. LS1R10]
MNSKIFISVVLLLISGSIFSQLKINISGKISAANVNLPDAIVELKVNGTSRFVLANNKGLYEFLDINYVETDSLSLRVKYLGYKQYVQLLKNVQKNNVFDVNMTSSEPENLKEVIVNTKEKIINSARKSSYKIDSKDFIKNAKVGEVLNTVPNVYIDQQGESAIVDGTLIAKIFIDGIEMMPKEVNMIDAADIDRVEVMNNPSAVYGTEFLGAVINIITKKKTEEFIKGSLGAISGISNDFWALNPSLSYKRGRFIIKSNYQYLQNTQKIDYSSTRFDNNGSFYQNNVNNSRNIQQNYNSRIGIKLSEKSNITLTNSLYGYKFISKANGLSILNNDAPDYFLKNNENSTKTWKIASVYNYRIKENKIFFVKSSYSIYDKGDRSTFNYSNGDSDFFNIHSKNKEFSVDVDYEAEELTIMKRKMGFYSNLKFINRNFNFSNTDFYINQNVISGSTELDTEWSEKFSTEMALTLENTSNFNATLNQNYSLILPTFNSIYHFNNKIDVKFSYSRKVLRPSANDLNDAVLIIYPGVARQGDSNLDPQIRSYNSITLSKGAKADNYSLKFYNESINNAITDVYRTQGNLLIQTLDNAAKYNAVGLNMGIRTKLFKKVMANLSSGFDYNTFEDNSSSAVIKKNSGYTFRGNIFLSTTLFKDKLSISFSGRQDGPNYSLLSKRMTNPYLDFTLSTNVFKDKLNISLYGKNLLGKIASGFSDISTDTNFYQRIDTSNNSSNLLLTLTYNFGKKFNDKIDDNDINNNDVRR